MAGLPLFRFGGEDVISMGKLGWAAGRPLLLLGGDGVGGGGVKKTVGELSWSFLAGDGDVIDIMLYQTQDFQKRSETLEEVSSFFCLQDLDPK